MNEPSTPLDDALAAWDRWSSAANLSPSTRYHYRYLAGRLMRWARLQGLTPSEVTSEDVERFLELLNLPVSTTSVGYRSRLRQFFDALVAEGLVQSNPLRHLPATDADDAPTAVLQSTADEFDALSEVEKQATVDAAAYALMLHSIYVFTEGQGGTVVDIDRCEHALRLGEQHGITPYSWADAGRLVAETEIPTDDSGNEAIGAQPDDAGQTP